MTDNTATPVQEEGAEQPSETQSNDGSQGSNSQFVGIQKRIDELVAKVHEREAEVTHLRQQNEVFMAQALKQYQQPAPVEPQYAVDPEEARRLKPMLAPYEQALQAVQRQLAQIQQFSVQQQMQQAAAKFGDPTVMDDATKLMQAWSSKGLQGWSPEDALVYAAGQRAMAARSAQDIARDQRGRFQGAGPEGGQRGMPLPSNGAGAPLPTNFDQLSPDQQMAILEKRGNLNTPF